MDALNMENLLTAEERNFRDYVEHFAQTELMPTVISANQNGKPDFNIFKKLGQQGFFGCTMSQKEGGLGMSEVGYGLLCKSLERVDTAYRSIVSIQSGLVISPIANYASQIIKDKYLQGLIDGDLVGSFGMTEPNHGSDPTSLGTTCRPTKDNRWVISGIKSWITFSPIADVFVILAKDVDKNIIREFVIDRHTPGLTTPKLEGVLSLKATEIGKIILEDVEVPDSSRLELEGLRASFSCLNNTRLSISWGVWGAAEFCYHYTLNLLLNQSLFDCKQAGFQLVQKRLAEMATEIAIGQLACLQVSRLKENGLLAPEMVNMMKRNSCTKSLEIARNCLDLLGESIITHENHVVRHVRNLETTITYGSTNDIQALVLGRAITGIQAFSRKL